MTEMCILKTSRISDTDIFRLREWDITDENDVIKQTYIYLLAPPPLTLLSLSPSLSLSHM